MPNGQSELEKLVVDWQKAGQEYVEAKLKADLLEEDQKPFLASLRNALDDGEATESKIEREAMGSKEYRGYINGMCLARADALRKRVRYEAFEKLFSAKQSELAMERAKIEKGIFHTGG